MNYKHAACAFALALSSLPAHADTWACEVLLCLSNPAGPTAVAQCVPPISKLWKHLAKGKGFPFCDMGGGSNAARNDWTSEQNCPPQYLVAGNDLPYCSYTGVITVNQNGQPYMRVWWSPGSTPAIENLNPDAPTTEASEKFMNDYAEYQAVQAAAAAWAAAAGAGN